MIGEWIPPGRRRDKSGANYYPSVGKLPVTPASQIEGGKTMPDVSRTEIGRRLFSLQKEKSIEQALEKIRKNLGEEWRDFSQEEIDLLKHALGDAWVFIERDVWEKIAFSRLSRRDVLDLIAIGRESRAKEIDQRVAVEKASRVLRATM